MLCYLCAEEILSVKTKEDTEKRKQLHELKTEMEREVKVFVFCLYKIYHLIEEWLCFTLDCVVLLI